MRFSAAGWWARAASCAVLAACAAAGCHPGSRGTVEPSPVAATDRDNPIDAVAALDDDEVKRAAEKVRVSRRPAVPPERTYNILAAENRKVAAALVAVP